MNTRQRIRLTTDRPQNGQHDPQHLLSLKHALGCGWSFPAHPNRVLGKVVNGVAVSERHES